MATSEQRRDFLHRQGCKLIALYTETYDGPPISLQELERWVQHPEGRAILAERFNVPEDEWTRWPLTPILFEALTEEWYEALVGGYEAALAEVDRDGSELTGSQLRQRWIAILRETR